MEVYRFLSYDMQGSIVKGLKMGISIESMIKMAYESQTKDKNHRLSRKEVSELVYHIAMKIHKEAVNQ